MRRTLFFILLFFCFQSYAQEKPLIFSAGLAVPIGDYGDANPTRDKSIGARTGFSLGVEYEKSISIENLSLIAGANLIFNPTSKKYKDAVDAGNMLFYGQVPDIKHSSYINLPISFGGKYRFPLDNSKGIFGKAGLSFNFLKRTNTVLQESGYEDYIEKFKLGTGVGFFIGAGFELNNQHVFSIGVRNLGMHSLKGEWEEASYSGKIETSKVPVSLIEISYGFRL